MRILCTTHFDITATGVKSHYKPSRIPFRDASGVDIADLGLWNRSRNKQRNWETMNQIIALRCLPYNISDPSFDSEQGTWSFEFDVDHMESISTHDAALDLLQQDCSGVPMIVGLDEQHSVAPMLVPGTNCWFELIPS